MQPSSMQQISHPGDVHAVLNDPSFIVPPVAQVAPVAQPETGTQEGIAAGMDWLRATVSRFSNGEVHARRRALVVELLDGIDPAHLREARPAHPVAVLAAALGVPVPALESIVDDVRLVAAAYQPGSGTGSDADGAVARLAGVFGAGSDGVADGDERTAARICLLVQACDATAALIERAGTRDLAEVLRDDPPVVATKRQATAPTTVGGVPVAAGEIIRLNLGGDPELAFGSGPRRCPGRAHALAIVEGALR
jgi:cytochrome P450